MTAWVSRVSLLRDAAPGRLSMPRCMVLYLWTHEPHQLYSLVLKKKSWKEPAQRFLGDARREELECESGQDVLKVSKRGVGRGHIKPLFKTWRLRM